MKNKTFKNTTVGKSIATGTLWLFVLKLSMNSLSLGSTVVLARLLTPHDFGLVAIAMSFIAIIELFSKFGFDFALIQKKNILREHFDTVWSFNIIFGVCAAFLVFFAAKPISIIYVNDDLSNLLRVLSIIFLINGCKNIKVVTFRKDMTFDKELLLQLIPKIIGTITFILSAFLLKNYWALVIGSLVWQGTYVIFSYIMLPYCPRFTFKAFSDLFGFSKWLLMNSILGFFNERSPELIVGKILSPQAAGFFKMAQELPSMLTTQVVMTINSAAFPGYSKVSLDGIELKQLYINVMSFISLIILPIGVGLTLVADGAVILVFGEQWIKIILLIIKKYSPC
jgi:lipopolysaccharide exporter